MRSTFLRSAALMLFLCAVQNLNAQTTSRTAFNELGIAIHLQYQYPVNGSTQLGLQTGIIIRQGDPIVSSSLSSGRIEVVGSVSGVHSGRLILSSDGRTILFNPDHSFDYNETVTVSVHAGFRTTSELAIEPFAFSFATRTAPPVTENSAPLFEGVYSTETWMAPAHPLDTLISGEPHDSVGVINNPESGLLFAAPFNLTDPSSRANFRMILDDSGKIIYSQRARFRDFDLDVQPNRLLTYFDGAAGKFYGMDSTYHIRDSFYCGMGLTTDLHDLQLLSNGHALLMSYDTIRNYPLAKYGGSDTAKFIANVIQEIDKDKNVIFQWRSNDAGHYLDTDATAENIKGKLYDAVHGNSLQIDNDGNIIFSARHLDEITKIDRSNGNMIWRWGGKHNQFRTIGDTVKFNHQHHVRRIANGHITMFDNGNNRTYSRAVEYAIDEVGKTDTLVWQYDRNKTVKALAMGSAQRLPNGNTLIGWGLNTTPTGGIIFQPAVTEVRPDSTVAFEMFFDAPYVSYREFRYVWPTTKAGVSMSEAQNPFSLGDPYPNPAGSRTTVWLAGPISEIVNIDILDILGRPVQRVYSGHISPVGQQMEIPTESLAAGSYSLMLSSGTSIILKKLIVAH